MKTVNKYILASCVFCYFAGLYLLDVKFGIMRFISHYGLSRAIEEWPADFPSLNLIYICLAVYTVFFIIITIWIYKACNRHGKEMDVLQQKASTLHNYSERLTLVISRFNRICREKNISNKTLVQRLQLLEKQIAALPASVFNNSSAGSQIAGIIGEIDDAVSSIETATENDTSANNQFSNLVERAIEDVQRLRTNSITIK
jgi:uncharacterized protein YoxC